MLSNIQNVGSMCEESVRYLKLQFGSNVIPIGAFTYGVCRHRAVLYKYLCDRAEPVIPCELVRGFMDNLPHAWNIILADTPTGTVRYAVDVCMPHAVHREDDPSHVARYLPLRSMEVPQCVLESFSGGDPARPLMHEVIGRGASGAVVRRCSLGDFTLAAKVATAPTGTIPPLNEILMLRSLPRHPSLVKFYGHSLQIVSHSPPMEELAIFFEYVAGGSLQDMIVREKENGSESLPVPLALHIAKVVAEGLSVLHRRGILHRDIKSANILVDCWEADSQPPVKLCDFSSAISVYSSSEHVCPAARSAAPPVDICVGTPRWMAPEVLRAIYGRYFYGMEADIWSFGCVLFEMLTLELPFQELPECSVHATIQMAQRPRLPPRLKQLLPSPRSSPLASPKNQMTEERRALQKLVHLFYKCTEASPKDRPTAENIVKQLSSCLDSLPSSAHKNGGGSDADNEDSARTDASSLIDTHAGGHGEVTSQQEKHSMAKPEVKEESNQGSQKGGLQAKQASVRGKKVHLRENSALQRPSSPKAQPSPGHSKSHGGSGSRSVAVGSGGTNSGQLCSFEEGGAGPGEVVEDSETVSPRHAAPEDQDLTS